MMTVNYRQYSAEKERFFRSHDYDFSCTTSEMDENGAYYKTYAFSDGAAWYESMVPTLESAEIESEIKKVKVTVEVTVKMMRTEYWSTESRSKYYYERF